MKSSKIYETFGIGFSIFMVVLVINMYHIQLTPTDSSGVESNKVPSNASLNPNDTKFVMVIDNTHAQKIDYSDCSGEGFNGASSKICEQNSKIIDQQSQIIELLKIGNCYVLYKNVLQQNGGFAYSEYQDPESLMNKCGSFP